MVENPFLPEQSLSTGTKSFPNIFVSTNFSEGFHLKKKNDKYEKKGFHKTENPSPPYRMKNSFKNTFPQDKDISLAGVSEKLTSTSQKIVSMSRKKVSLKRC